MEGVDGDHNEWEVAKKLDPAPAKLQRTAERLKELSSGHQKRQKTGPEDVEKRGQGGPPWSRATTETGRR